MIWKIRKIPREVLSDNAGLQIPRLISGWNGRQGREGAREKTGKAVDREVADGILRDDGIRPSANVPCSSQVKHTNDKSKLGSSGANGKKASLGVWVRSWIGSCLKYVGVGGKKPENPTRRTTKRVKEMGG